MERPLFPMLKFAIGTGFSYIGYLLLARVLFSWNFASAQFRRNKTLATISDNTAILTGRSLVRWLWLIRVLVWCLCLRSLVWSLWLRSLVWFLWLGSLVWSLCLGSLVWPLWSLIRRLWHYRFPWILSLQKKITICITYAVKFCVLFPQLWKNWGSYSFLPVRSSVLSKKLS